MATKRLTVLVLSVAVILSGGIGSGIVVAAQIQGGSTRLGGAVEAVRIADLQGTTQATSSTSLVPLGSTKISVPAGHTDLVVARFDAQTLCSGAPATNCLVQLRAGHAVMLPDAATAAVFVSAPANLEAHSIQRYLCLSGGASGQTYSISAYYAVTDVNTTFSVPDW